MNLYKVNLNLLKVFQVLMREKQVTLTAKKLHLTQSAISNSLNQLRELFQDELFVRGVGKMSPTQRALDLGPQVEQVLRQIESFIIPEQIFDPTTADRTFTLGMTDYLDFILLPKLYESLKKQAPNISLKILSVHEFSAEVFAQQQVELGMGFEKKLNSQSLNHESLFSDYAVCVGRANHPLFKKPITLERYLQAEHIRTTVYSGKITQTDTALAKLNLKRNIKITLPEILPALKIIAHSDLIGTFSHKLASQSTQSHRLQYTNPPFKIPEVKIMQVWHRQQDQDPGLLWLRSLIKKLCHSKEFNL